MYNQLYAPEYPAEDRTNLEQEETIVISWFTLAIEATEKTEDIGDWLRLSSGSAAAAFEKFRKGNCNAARKDIEAAIQYLRNAGKRRPHKVDFVVGPDGNVTRTTGDGRP